MAEVGETVTEGSGETVMVTEAVQPLLSVTVYVVVESGLAITDEPVVWFKPLVGDQVYAPIPSETVMVALLPRHIVAAVGETINESTVIYTESLIV